jgi:hypothetical protein
MSLTYNSAASQIWESQHCCFILANHQVATQKTNKEYVSLGTEVN